ncbi:MAG: hypothetical protein GY796_19310, partial [Chloroflexi bacterium]|nr:hypothetical protein [Chloroflexota bacterium]
MNDGEAAANHLFVLQIVKLWHLVTASPVLRLKENIQIPQTTLAKLYPDIGLGMLRQELAAPGRIWLLLRCYDVSGRGWVDVTQARAMLTGKEAVLKVCGWRQLRNLFRQGEDV